VNRADLMRRFGVSVPQATMDLGRYQDAAPGNLAYDRRAKAYLATDAFAPLYGAPSAENWLHAHAGANGRTVPPVEVLPLPRRALDPWLLRRILQAWRGKRSLRLQYQTMERDQPEPSWRWFVPLAFASDGLRWHVRGFNEDARRHEDVLLPRIIELAEDRAAGPTPLDEDWKELVVLRIRPAPGLSLSQQDAVTRDYAMVDGMAAIPVRAALLDHLIRALRLDHSSRLIEIANRAEVQATLERIQRRFADREEV